MESRVDVAVFLSSFAGGGAERVILFLCEEFCKRGLLVDLVVFNTSGPLISLVPKNANLVKLNCRKPIFSIIKISKYLKKNKPHSIFSALTHINIVCSIAYRISRIKSNLVLSERSDITEDLSSRISRFDVAITKLLIKRFYSNAYNIVTISKGSAKSINKLLKNTRNKIITIYNPVNQKYLYHLSIQHVELPWDDQLPVIISSGRLVLSKDFQCLIESFSILRKRIPSNLIILGDGDLRSDLNDLVHSLDIRNNVWFPGYCLNPFPFMRRSKLFVLPSRIEGLSNVLLEALALGIPIVSTNCPSGPEEILAGGKYGRLVPVGDPFAMAEAMEKSLLGDHPVFDKEEALRRFHPELITNQYLEALGFPNSHNTASNIAD